MIHPIQRPAALVISPLDVDVWGDLDALDAYLASGQAARDWEAIIAEHSHRLLQACLASSSSWWRHGHTVWMAELIEQGEV